MQFNVTRTYKSGTETLQATEIFNTDGVVAVDASVPASGASQTAYAVNASRLKSLYATSNQPVTIYPNGSAGQFAIQLSAGLTAGTFTLTYQSQTTTGISFSPTAASIQSAFCALSSVGTGNCILTGSGLSYSGQFCGTLAPGPTTTISSNVSGLSGGTPAVTITPLNVGAYATAVIPIAANVPFEWSSFNGYFPSPMQVATCAANASTSATSITVNPLPYKLASGTQLVFGAVTATLTSNANAKDRSIAVSSLSGGVSQNTSAVADWTTLYIVNAGTSAAVVNFRAGQSA